jgi:prevent-host-death family protein
VADVSIRDLRNRGGDIVERAARGEDITITRSGKPVAQLRSTQRPPLSLDALLSRRAHLAPVDPRRLSRDVDATLDPSL